MSVTFVSWKPFLASTRVAAVTSSLRVRCRRRSKRLPVGAGVEASFMTESLFTFRLTRLSVSTTPRPFSGGRAEERDDSRLPRVGRRPAGLGDEDRLGPVLYRHRWRLSGDQEPGEGPEGLSHGRNHVGECQRGALEPPHRVSEAEGMVADQLSPRAGDVDQPRAPRGRAGTADRHQRLATLELEDRDE